MRWREAGRRGVWRSAGLQLPRVEEGPVSDLDARQPLVTQQAAQRLAVDGGAASANPIGGEVEDVEGHLRRTGAAECGVGGWCRSSSFSVCARAFFALSRSMTRRQCLAVRASAAVLVT